MGAAPFHLRYDLSRGQRLGPHVLPWAPCLGASLGYALGIAFLANVVSAWFLPHAEREGYSHPPRGKCYGSSWPGA